MLVRMLKILPFILAIIYALMLADTNSLMREVEGVFYGKADVSITQGKPIDLYNITENNTEDIVNLELHRVFVLHNFRDGYIWVCYTCSAKTKTGEIVNGSSNIHSEWKIHKKNGKWEIVDIYENP